MKKEKKTNKKIFIIIAIVLVMLIGGVSFALWQFTYEGTQTNILSSESVSIEYLESSDIIDLKNALPMNDDKGEEQLDTFDFAVTTRTASATNISYTLTLEELAVDESYTKFESNQVKVYLEDYDGNVLVGPKKISQLKDYVLYSVTNAHNNTVKVITDKYKLRVWIDQDVLANDWDETTKLQYKFRVNVSTGNTESVGLSDDAIAFAKLVSESEVGGMVRLSADVIEDYYTPTYQYYIISKNNNKALLMYYSAGGGGGNGLHSVFDDNSNDWGTSNLRSYLNSTDENGFLRDKSVLNELIMDTTVQTRNANDLTSFVSTTDRVFIMSEADRLGTNQGIAISYTESPQDYTVTPGENGNVIPDGIVMTGSGVRFELDIMWLRTPGSNGNVRYATTRNGGLNGETSPATQGVVLPIFWIDISSANSN